MGVKKYNNKFRAAVNINGKPTQTYFDTEQEALNHVAHWTAINVAFRDKKYPWAKKRKRRPSAKHQELPVGWTDYTVTQPLASGAIGKYHILCCQFELNNGKRTHLRANYGIQCTREEAIKKLEKRVLARLKEDKQVT